MVDFAERLFLLHQMMDEWDEDLRQRPSSDTKTLKLRQSEVRNLQPLKDLCLRNITHHMDKIWCKDFISQWSGQDVAFLLGPFDELPGSLVTSVMQALRDKNMLHFRFLLPLVTCNIESLDLSNLKGINKVLVAVKYRCSVLLKELNLEQCKGLAMSPFKDTLACLKNLQVLNLKQIGVGDDVLATLGSNNPRLRELYLCSNSSVSNAGIEALCVEDGHLGKCKDLAVLTLEFTQVDENGLLTALENLPKLVVLEHNLTCKAVVSWFYLHPNSTLQLKRMMFDLLVVSPEEISDITQICPQLHDLEFLPCEANTVDISTCLNITQLTKFKSQQSVLPPLAWIIYLGHSLTELSLVDMASSDEIDLTVLGKSCPDLAKLQIHDAVVTESYFEGDHFKSIKTVSLGNAKQTSNLEQNLKCILTSVFLRSVTLVNFLFGDEFIRLILHESTLNKQVLSQLRYFELTFCNNVTGEILEPLMCLAPRISHLAVNHCKNVSLINMASFSSFVTDNKINVKVDWA